MFNCYSNAVPHRTRGTSAPYAGAGACYVWFLVYWLSFELTNTGLVTEFSERELGTNPWFKKPRAIGEKVAKAHGKVKGFALRKGQNKSLKGRIDIKQ